MTNGSARQVVMVAGATGLVGRSLVEQLCGSPPWANVVALTRRPLEFEHDKLQVRLVDLARLEDEQAPHVDVACCALGTTIATAGSQEAFRRVDYDFTLAFARFAERGGARRFLLVSSVGADAGSANFYLRVKGEVENAVRALPFEALVILRPGLLLGDRRESRPAETVARAVAPLLNPLLFGPLAKFRSIRADRVAAAMVAAATDDRSGVTVLETPAIEALARS
jgi:uncharacterized protein YbjT (DUF2867 family)